MARWTRISERISSGMVAMGQGGAGERSVGGASPWMVRVEKSSRRDWRETGRPWREWWAGLGTVGEALEGLVFEFVVVKSGAGAGGL
jgi:hypothetical protein